mgnify:CR=1 FL=1
MAEVRDSVAAFDDKAAALAKARLVTEAALNAQELYMVQLAVAVQQREEAMTRERVLDALEFRQVPEEEGASNAAAAFAATLAAQDAAIEELTAKDKGAERGFREAMREAAGGSLDGDAYRALLTLYRKRTAPPPPPSTLAATSALGPPGLASAGPSVVSLVGGGGGAATTGAAAALRRMGSNKAMVADGGGDASAAAASSSASASAGGSIYDASADAYDAPYVSEAARAAAEREAALAPLTRADCPDGFGALADNAPLWARLQAQRAAKIGGELDVAAAVAAKADMGAHLARLTAAFETVKGRLDGLAAERDQLARAREVAVNDTLFLLRLKMGQDEVAGNDGAVADYADAMLLPADVIEAVNVDIRKHGSRKVDILTDIKDFRRNLLYMEWEGQYLRASLEDMGEYYRDLQLMRAAGAVGEHIKGVNVVSKARKEADKAVERLAYMKVAHGRLMDKLRKSAARLAGAVAERAGEVAALDAKRLALEESVALRENIMRTRQASAAHDEGGAPADRMKLVAAKTRLVAVTKAQAAEIDTLARELARLNARAVPVFPPTPAVPL